MIQGVNPTQASSLPPIVPVSPAAPPLPPTPTPAPLAVDLQPFLESIAAVGSAPSAVIEANQLNFDRLSSHILAQVGPQTVDGNLSLRLGDKTLEIPLAKLDKASLMQALKARFGELQQPDHIATARDLQAGSRALVVEILNAAPVAETPLLKTLTRNLEKQVPAKTREAYGLNAATIEAWRQTGQTPAGVEQLLQDYAGGKADRFQAILHVVALGKAVTEARAGRMSPAAKAEALKEFEGMKTLAVRQWERQNAAAVATSRKVAEQAFGAWSQADQQVQSLAERARLLSSLSQPTPDEQALLAQTQQDLKAAQTQAQGLLGKQQKAQQVALQSSHAMREVRLHHLELQGAQASPGLRHLAAGAILDTAGVEARGAHYEAQTGHITQASQLPEGVGRSQALVADAEQVVPDWAAHPELVRQREGVLNDQRSVLLPLMQHTDTRTQLESTAAQLRTQLSALPTGEMALPAHQARRKQWEDQLQQVEADLGLTAPPPAPDSPEGQELEVADTRLAQQYATHVHDLQRTYGAQLQRLQNTPGPELREVSRRSRDLHVEATQFAQAGLDADLAVDQRQEAATQWSAFGQQDAQQRIEAARQNIAKYADPKTPGERFQLEKAQKELLVATQAARSGATEHGADLALPGDRFAQLRAQALSQALGASDVAGLRSQGETAATNAHTLVRRSYQGAPEVLAEDAAFGRVQARLATQAFSYSQRQANLGAFRDQGTVRVAADQRQRLAEIAAALPKAEGSTHDKLVAEQTRLRADLHAFDQTPVGEWGPELLEAQRLQDLSTAPLAQLRELRDQQAARVDAALTMAQQDPATVPVALDTLVSSIGTLPQYQPGTTAQTIAKAQSLIAQLPPEAQADASRALRQQAASAYQAYIHQPHSLANGEAGQLAAQLDQLMQAAPAGDVGKQQWEQVRRDSDPRALFQNHRDELRQALPELEKQVTGDIETMYKLAVERGGWTLGTVARTARSLAQEGDIEGAKRLLRAAVEKAITEADQAEKTYLSLPPAQQENYRAILRSTAPGSEQQDALATLLGGNTALAAQALHVAQSSHTMVKAHEPGSDYSLTRSAHATAQALADPLSGLQARGGAEADALAARYTRQRERDERYWNDPNVAVMAAAVDEATMFVLTLGTSALFSAAKGAYTGSRLAMQLARQGQRLEGALSASRAGRALWTAGKATVGADRFLTTQMARVDGFLQARGALGAAGSVLWRGARGMGRNIAIEQGMKGSVALAETVGGKDSWLVWAADTSGRLFSSGVGEIKGLDSLQNSAWTLFETGVTQKLLPAYYQGKELEQMQDLTHYLLMGVQTAHGMHQMRQQADSQAFLGAGLSHDLQAAGVKIEPHHETALIAEAKRYQDSLLNNHGILSASGHEAFAQRVREITGATHLPESAPKQVEALISDYQAPIKLQSAATQAGVDQLRFDKASAPEVQVAVQRLREALQSQGFDAVEAQKIAQGHVAGQLVTTSAVAAFGWLHPPDATTAHSPQSLRETQIKHMTETARELVAKGAVDHPAQAMALVTAQMRAGLHDAAQKIDLNTPEGQTQRQALEQTLAQLTDFAHAWQFTSAAIDPRQPWAADLHAQLLQTVQTGGEGDLYTRLRATTETVLTTHQAKDADAAKIAAETALHWGERQLMHMPAADPAARYEQHRQVFSELGVPKEVAAQAAHDRYLGEVGVQYRSMVPPEAHGVLEQQLYQVFSDLGNFPHTGLTTQGFAKERIAQALKAAGVSDQAAWQVARSLIQDGLAYGQRFQGPDALARTRRLDASLHTALHLEGVTLQGKPIQRLSELRAALTPEVLNDPQQMFSLYEQLGGWDTIRKLSNFVAPEVFAQLHQARDQKVAECWKAVEAEAAQLGVTLAKPYVGRGPGEKGYTGVYADIDMVVRITGTSDGKPRNEAEIAQTELALVRSLQTRLNALTDSPGHMLDVNAYTTPHFLALAMPGQSASEAALKAHAANERAMDFYQLRQGFGQEASAWQTFQTEAIRAAEARDTRAEKAGKPAGEAERLRQGFAATDAAWEIYQTQVAAVEKTFDPSLPAEVRAEMARTQVRENKAESLERFLADNRETLFAPTEAGTAARVEYFRRQMDLRAASPEAYAGNLAVYWGSRGGAEQQAVLDRLAGDLQRGGQGRISHAQYILHWAVEAPAHGKPLYACAWKAGKYDLRDSLFVDAMTPGQRLIEAVENPEHRVWVERKQADPTVQIPADVPQWLPANRIDQAVAEARAKAQTPEQARDIWIKHFGSPEKAEQAMKDYLLMLQHSVQDTAGRHLSQP